MLLRRLWALGRTPPSRGVRGGSRALCTGERRAGPAEVGSSPSPYRDTVLLPRTDFPMKVTGQKLLDQEAAIQKVRV